MTDYIVNRKQLIELAKRQFDMTTSFKQDVAHLRANPVTKVAEGKVEWNVFEYLVVDKNKALSTKTYYTLQDIIKSYQGKNIEIYIKESK